MSTVLLHTVCCFSLTLWYSVACTVCLSHWLCCGWYHTYYFSWLSACANVYGRFKYLLHCQVAFTSHIIFSHLEWHACPLVFSQDGYGENSSILAYASVWKSPNGSKYQKVVYNTAFISCWPVQASTDFFNTGLKPHLEFDHWISWRYSTPTEGRVTRLSYARHSF